MMDRIGNSGFSTSEATLKRELDVLITQMHSSGVPYPDAVRQFKKRYILEVLAQHKGNQCKAADELGMHRNTLSRTLTELEISTAQVREHMRDGSIRGGMRRPPNSERTIQNSAATFTPRVANSR